MLEPGQKIAVDIAELDDEKLGTFLDSLYIQGFMVEKSERELPSCPTADKFRSDFIALYGTSPSIALLYLDDKGDKCIKPIDSAMQKRNGISESDAVTPAEAILAIDK